MNKPTKLAENIPGTKISVSNAQLLISSGIPSLDDLIGLLFEVIFKECNVIIIGQIPFGKVTLIFCKSSHILTILNKNFLL